MLPFFSWPVQVNWLIKESAMVSFHALRVTLLMSSPPNALIAAIWKCKEKFIAPRKNQIAKHVIAYQIISYIGQVKLFFKSLEVFHLTKRHCQIVIKDQVSFVATRANFVRIGRNTKSFSILKTRENFSLFSLFQFYIYCISCCSPYITQNA